MEEDEGTGRVATNPIKLIRTPKTPRKPDPRISRCKHPENHTSNSFGKIWNCNRWVSYVQIIPHCLICVSLVNACSALVVSHPRCRNRCGGGSHLKILIQAHCPLMFPQNIFHSLCIERLMVFIMGSPFLPWWSGVCTIRWMTWMTDWITRITILHHSLPLYVCN